jgi:hypothetical protein
MEALKHVLLFRENPKGFVSDIALGKPFDDAVKGTRAWRSKDSGNN